MRCVPRSLRATDPAPAPFRSQKSGNGRLGSRNSSRNIAATCSFMVGVAGFEPAASSSRSQVPARTASAAACLTWEAPSVGVRWRPSLPVAIVTHLVTQLRSLTCVGRSNHVWVCLRQKADRHSSHPLRIAPVSDLQRGALGAFVQPQRQHAVKRRLTSGVRQSHPLASA